VETRGVIVADGVKEMARAVLELLVDPAAAARLGSEGHHAVATNHSWEAALSPLIEALAQ
jgi:glycosyltransferase involved in cell wall biosynthesis